MHNDSVPPGLGPLEIAVLEILWTRGESTVREVAAQLDPKPAYTTVMTTLDRLFKKGVLHRRKEARAFSYWPRWSRQEWEQKRLGDLLASLLAGTPLGSGNLLISRLVDAVGKQDEALLDELERRIRMRREEVERGRQA